MTHKTVTAVALALAGSLALLPTAAFAHDGTSGEGSGGGGVQMGVSAKIHVEAGDDSATSSDDSATSSEERGKSMAHASSTVSASTSAGRGEGASGERNSVGEEHRSEVANIVHQLLLDADRDGGIGAEVRAVASAQASSSITGGEALAKLESEGGFKKFLLGPDYKSLGELRSALTTTENSITRLEHARGRSTNATVQADLDVQIAALKGVASSTQAYVAAHAGGFSLFGWLVRLVGV